MRQYGRLGEPGTRRGLLSLRLEAYCKFLEHGIEQSVSRDVGDTRRWPVALLS